MSPRRCRITVPAAAVAACLAGLSISAVLVPGAADAAAATPASEVARTGVWANTSAGTPAVWGSGSSPCWADVAVRAPASWSARLQRTPLPCTFAPAPGADGEAIVVDQTGRA